MVKIGVTNAVIGTAIGVTALLSALATEHCKVSSVSNPYANREGVQIGPVLETYQDIELLTVDATCPLPWMSYTACEPLPVGAVTGGRLADGSETYVVKVIHNKNELLLLLQHKTSSGVL